MGWQGRPHVPDTQPAGCPHGAEHPARCERCVYTYTAEFSSVCPACREPMQRGSTIARYEGRWLHPECVGR